MALASEWGFNFSASASSMPFVIEVFIAAKHDIMLRFTLGRHGDPVFPFVFKADAKRIGGCDLVKGNTKKQLLSGTRINDRTHVAQVALFNTAAGIQRFVVEG